MPKGVMWRHEDIFFAAMMGGNPYGPQPVRPEDVAESAKARGIVTMLPAAPLIHGAAQWAAFIGLYGGGKVVIAPGKRFDPTLVWQLAAEEKVNSITIVGDAMARPLAEALEDASFDLSSLRVIGSGGAILSEHVKDQLKQHMPNVVVMDNFGGSEAGAQGQHVGRGADGTAPRFRADADDRRPRRRAPAARARRRATWAGSARRAAYRSATTRTRRRRPATFVEIDGVALGAPRRHGHGRGGRHDHAARPRLRLHQQRRREDLPRGGRGGSPLTPGRLRRRRRRRARREVGRARHGRRSAARGAKR